MVWQPERDSKSKYCGRMWGGESENELGKIIKGFGAKHDANPAITLSIELTFKQDDYGNCLSYDVFFWIAVEFVGRSSCHYVICENRIVTRRLASVETLYQKFIGTERMLAKSKPTAVNLGQLSLNCVPEMLLQDSSEITYVLRTVINTLG